MILTRYIPHAVTIAGATVCALWLTGLERYAHLGRGGTVMMPTTAFGFVLAATAVHYEPIRTNAARFGVLALSVALIGNAIVPMLFKSEPHDPATELTMAVATALTFAGMGLHLLARCFTWGEDWRGVVGTCVAIVGACAIVGHTFDIPAAFFRDPGRSNGMALNTAILFLLLGIRVALPPRVKA